MWLWLCLLWGNNEAIRPLYYDVDVARLERPVITLLKELCMDLTDNRAEFLIEIGAVSVRDKSAKKIKWERLCSQSSTLGAWGQQVQLRIYEEPRRFTSACQALEDDPLYESVHCVVVNKPHGLPVQAHPSNSRECLLPCVQGQLKGEVHLVHRLDAATSGIILLARSMESKRYFTRLFEQRDQIEKTYSTLTATAVPIGTLSHFQYKKRLGAQLLSTTQPSSDRGAWKQSELEVLSCVEHTDGLYSSEIRLLTGRKHQIRSQLAAIGCPILDDTLYNPIAGLTYDEVSEEIGVGVEDFLLADERWSNGRSPESIELHASSLMFRELDSTERVQVYCPPPWLEGNNYL